MRSQERQQTKSWWNTQGLATMRNLQQFSIAVAGVENKTLNPARVIAQKDYNHWIFTIKKCTEPLSKLNLTRGKWLQCRKFSLLLLSLTCCNSCHFPKPTANSRGKWSGLYSHRVGFHGSRAKHTTEEQKMISSAHREKNPPQKHSLSTLKSEEHGCI